MKTIFQLDLSTDGQQLQDSIPLLRKLSYAVGGVPYQITTAAIGVSLQIFLLDVVQLEPFYVSLVLFVSRAWDAATDPLVGYLVSRSRWTPVGKLTPWLVLSTPLAVLSYLLLWFSPRGTRSVIWFLTASCLFETVMSCYHVPYLTLNMCLGGNQRERDSATAYRMSVEMVSMLLASLIQGQVVSVYNTEKQEICEGQLVQEAPHASSSPAALRETQKAFLTSALVIGGVIFTCGLVLFLGVKEHAAPVVSVTQQRLSYPASLRIIFSLVPFQRLLLGFLFSSFAFQMSLGNFALFCSHAAELGSQFQHLLLVLLVSASVAVPLWQLVLLRIGKKSTLLVGLSIFIPAAIVVACVPGSLPVAMTMCVLMGFSVATVFLLPWSMLPDVVDLFSSQHPSVSHLEPLFFSCYLFSTKLVGGLSIGVSTMTLHFVGYKANDCHHGNQVATALTVLFAPVPIVLLLVGMIFFHFYAIDEKRLSTQEPEDSLTSSDQREISRTNSCSVEASEMLQTMRSHDSHSLRSQKSSGKTSRCNKSVDQNLHRLLTVGDRESGGSTEESKKRSQVSWV